MEDSMLAFIIKNFIGTLRCCIEKPRQYLFIQVYEIVDEQNRQSVAETTG